MAKCIKVILVIALTWMINACSNKEDQKVKEIDQSKKDHYTYEAFRSTYTSEAFIKELDTSKWILNSYWIHPPTKSSFNLTTNDSLYYHRITNKNSDLYSFNPSSGLIFKKNVKIGTIKKEKFDFDSIKDLSGKELGIKYHTLFYISQPNDSFMNGLFNVNYSKNERLHITQVRTNNETKEEEVVKFIFYKK